MRTFKVLFHVYTPAVQTGSMNITNMWVGLDAPAGKDAIGKAYQFLDEIGVSIQRVDLIDVEEVAEFMDLGTV